MSPGRRLSAEGLETRAKVASSQQELGCAGRARVERDAAEALSLALGAEVARALVETCRREDDTGAARGNQQSENSEGKI